MTIFNVVFGILGLVCFTALLISLGRDHSQDAIERDLQRPLVLVKRKLGLEDNTKLGMSIVAAIVVMMLIAAYLFQ